MLLKNKIKTSIRRLILKENKNIVIIPDEIKSAWDQKEDAVVLTTVNKNGMPDSIYATCVSRFNDSIFVVADNYFDKTKKNILDGSKGTLLFITKEGKSYQLKGSFEYLTEGEIFDDMKKWNPEKHPGHAAAALKVESVYKGAKKLV